MKYKLRSGHTIHLDADWKDKLKKYMAITHFEFAVRPAVLPNGYLYFIYGYEKISAHRAMLNYYGKQEVDHIDGNPLNNCTDNLRVCSRSENTRNRGISKSNTTGFKGVIINEGKTKTTYTAQIRVDGVQHRLGTFDTIEEAAMAYDDAAVKYHGMFAKTNKELGLLEKTNAKPIPLPSC